MVASMVLLTACGSRPNPPLPDKPGLYIEPATASEADGRIVFNVSLYPRRSRPVTVSYSFVEPAIYSDFTARPGEDFAPFSATELTFAAGEQEKQIVVSLVNDGRFERDELLNVRLDTAPSGVEIVQRQAEGKVLNDDDEPRATFVSPDGLSGNLTEGFGVTRTFSVKLGAISGLPASFSFAYGKNISELPQAVARGDYVIKKHVAGSDPVRISLQETFTIPAGSDTMDFSVEVVDDGVEEPTELLYFGLLAKRDVSTGGAVMDLQIPANDAPDYSTSGFAPVTATGTASEPLSAGDYQVLNVNGGVHQGSETVGCVHDVKTGLTWEAKLEDDDSLHSVSLTVDWFDPDLNHNGGEMGSIGDTEVCTAKGVGLCNTMYFMADVNLENLCGISNWRLPTLEELRALVNYANSPEIFAPELTGKVNTQSVLWSSDTYATSGHKAWTMVYAEPNSLVGALARRAFPQDKAQGDFISVRLVSEDKPVGVQP